MKYVSYVRTNNYQVNNKAILSYLKQFIGKRQLEEKNVVPCAGSLQLTLPSDSQLQPTGCSQQFQLGFDFESKK